MSSGYWRHLYCEGCALACQYFMFRPLTGDFTLGRRRNGHRERQAAKKRCTLCKGCTKARQQDNATFREIVRQMHKESDNPKDWRYRRRGTVLGWMHAAKLELWESVTRSCPYWGVSTSE